MIDLIIFGVCVIHVFYVCPYKQYFGVPAEVLTEKYNFFIFILIHLISSVIEEPIFYMLVPWVFNHYFYEWIITSFIFAILHIVGEKSKNYKNYYGRISYFIAMFIFRYRLNLFDNIYQPIFIHAFYNLLCGLTSIIIIIIMYSNSFY